MIYELRVKFSCDEGVELVIMDSVVDMITNIEMEPVKILRTRLMLDGANNCRDQGRKRAFSD